MKIKNLYFSKIISSVLIVAMALTFCGCSSEKNSKNNDSVITQSSINATELGEGEKTFNLGIYDANGDLISFVIRTDKKTVGDALLEQDLIKGETSDYGLYVKEVNDIVADYDTDGTFWGFYINGEMANTGVDDTEIIDGATYEFKLSK